MLAGALLPREEQVAGLVLLRTGGGLYQAFGPPLSSDFLFCWYYWNDNKETTYLICQLAFLSLGKYLILFFFFFGKTSLLELYFH